MLGQCEEWRRVPGVLNAQDMHSGRWSLMHSGRWGYVLIVPMRTNNPRVI